MIQEECYERVVVVLGQKMLQLWNAMPGVVTCHVFRETGGRSQVVATAFRA